MQERHEEFEEQPKKRRKKKRRFGYYLYAVTVLILTLAIILTATFLVTYVQKIEVEGTKYTKESQIVSWLKEDPYTFNSLYTVLKHKIVAPTIPSYAKSVEVSFGAPWVLRVNIQEKEVVACVLSGQHYVYFSKDGTVMLKQSEKLEEFPVVEGLETEDAVLYSKLKIGDEKIFKYAISISEEIQKNQLMPDRLVWEEDSMNLYFDEICVCLGKMNFDEKLVELPPILEELEGKKGTLHMEHYSEMSSSISFVEYTEEPVAEPVEEPVEEPEVESE